MNGKRAGAALRLVWIGAVLAGGIAAAGTAMAQDEGGDPVINAEVTADLDIRGGDAAGGDAAGGDAGLSAVVSGTGGDGGQGNVHVQQEATLLEGGDAQGGDATGGDGLNAFVDADVVLDADVALDVAADVVVDTSIDADANADVTVPDVGLGSLAREPGAGNLDVPDLANADLPGAGTGGLPDLGGTLGSTLDGPQTAQTPAPGQTLGGLGGVLGGLGGLNLLDLVVDLEADILGGDAAGGDAAGGDALLQAVVADTENGSVALTQETSFVFGGDATGGTATGGDGIELDVFLVADIDLIVDAAVDVAADVTTVVDANVDADTQRRLDRRSAPARLGAFETLE